MKSDISFHNINKDSHEAIRTKIEKLVDRHLSAHIAAFNPSQLQLHTTVEKLKNDKYKVVFRLHLPPKKILVAKEVNEQINTAIIEAIEELAHQATRHQAKISGREQWRRKDRHKRIKTMQAKVATTLPTEAEQKSADDALIALLPKIDDYIAHELAYLWANGDLMDSYPTLEDIRDEAIIQVKINWDNFDKNEALLYQELIKIVHDIIQKEIEQTKLHEEDISIEAEIPKDAMDQAEDMVEEEIHEFYHPSEVQHIKDLLPDSTAVDPKELTEYGARSSCYQILCNMPAQWRRILIMIYREGLPIGFIAKNILSYSKEDTESLLDKAETFMLDSLAERNHNDLKKNDLGRLLKRREQTGKHL